MSHAGQVIGYVRVSTGDQSLSAEAQRHRIHEWCRMQGLELVAIYEDVGVSGGAKLENRPGILDALNALKPGMTPISFGTNFAFYSFITRFMVTIRSLQV